MLNDCELLAEVPDFLSIESMFKALPAEEAGRRFIYFEASNEGIDQQNEVVLAKALEASADMYLRYGNLDLDHLSLIGKPNPAKGYPGLPNPELYEIGRPVAVRADGKRTFVKAELYQGEGDVAKNANMVWESMTKVTPAARWYPSVGGAVLSKSIKIDPSTKEKVAVVDKVRWTNVGLSRTPVNQHVPEASTVAFGALAKSWNGSGFVMKTLTAGYGTDSAGMTGGRALAKQSLDRRPHNYFDFRERLAKAVKTGRVRPANAQTMSDWCVKEQGMSHDEAAEHVERFTRDLKTELNRSTRQ